jgi:hypothetical protein
VLMIFRESIRVDKVLGGEGSINEILEPQLTLLFWPADGLIY